MGLTPQPGTQEPSLEKVGTEQGNTQAFDFLKIMRIKEGIWPKILWSKTNFHPKKKKILTSQPLINFGPKTYGQNKF